MINDDPQKPELTLEISKFHKYPVIGRVLKFFTWWLIFSGIYASSAVCPFCGRLGCPVGGAGAGMVGGFFAILLGPGKIFLKYLTGVCHKIRAKIKLN